MVEQSVQFLQNFKFCHVLSGNAISAQRGHTAKLDNTSPPTGPYYATLQSAHHKTLPRNHTNSTQNHPGILCCCKGSGY